MARPRFLRGVRLVVALVMGAAGCANSQPPESVGETVITRSTASVDDPVAAVASSPSTTTTVPATASTRVGRAGQWLTLPFVPYDPDVEPHPSHPTELPRPEPEPDELMLMADLCWRPDRRITLQESGPDIVIRLEAKEPDGWAVACSGGGVVVHLSRPLGGREIYGVDADGTVVGPLTRRGSRPVAPPFTPFFEFEGGLS